MAGVATWSRGILSQEAEGNERWCSALFLHFPFIRSKVPAHGFVPLSVQVGLLTSITPKEKLPQGHAYSFVSFCGFGARQVDSQ